MISLKDKVAIITGGSRGIGAAIARLFAQAGCHVTINFRENRDHACALAQEINALGREALLCQGNIAQAQTSRELVDATIARFGRLDIVVNNAGIWTYGELGDITEQVWDETIQVNLKGTFNLSNAAAAHFKRVKGGRIINIASTAGQRGEAFHSHYAASKGGVIAFTRSLASELAPYGILVNAVAPGWVDTDMNGEVFADGEYRRQVEQSIPLHRIATAEDVAGPVLFLASDLSRHVTGATINVNGGSVLA